MACIYINHLTLALQFQSMLLITSYPGNVEITIVTYNIVCFYYATKLYFYLTGTDSLVRTGDI